MNSVSIKDLVPLAISGLGAMAVPMQTFNYNDVEQNNIQLADNNALSHLNWHRILIMEIIFTGLDFIKHTLCGLTI